MPCRIVFFVSTDKFSPADIEQVEYNNISLIYLYLFPTDQLTIIKTILLLISKCII